MCSEEELTKIALQVTSAALLLQSAHRHLIVNRVDLLLILSHVEFALLALDSRLAHILELVNVFADRELFLTLPAQIHLNFRLKLDRLLGLLLP